MRNIPTITKNLLIINVLMFAAYFVFSRLNIDLNSLLGLHFFLVSDFHLYQLVTYMFMHAGLSHIFFNMFGLTDVVIHEEPRYYEYEDEGGRIYVNARGVSMPLNPNFAPVMPAHFLN